jgi:endonuclease/exonuclease/phosphatase family metal-dependent hydrolase
MPLYLKNKTVLLIHILLFLASSAQAAPPCLNSLPNRIRVASFNIQIFGSSKREKAEVLDVLVKTVRHFDFIAIQEFRDSSMETLPFFLEKINEMEGPRYAAIGSERLGRTDSKERYGFFWNEERIDYASESYVFDDVSDGFEREPFVARFRAGDFDFIAVNVHIKPDDAPAEIALMEAVVEQAVHKYEDDQDVIVFGDFNADGSYFSEEILDGFRNPKIYTWLIPDYFDTTVGGSSNTYDRIIIVSEHTYEDAADTIGVFRFDEVFGLSVEQSEEVSDHFPVWVELWIDQDMD